MAGFALRALGMVFRVFVAARLGPEGMGLYQLILSVYMVFVSLASAGINVASTRLGAQCLTRGRGMTPALRSLAATAVVLGTAAMLAQLALADPLARFALHDSRAELGLCTLAPSLPFIAAAGALRGCFLARRRVEPNIIAQLVEQTVRMAVAALALVKLAHWGAAYACCAVLIGNTVSHADHLLVAPECLQAPVIKMIDDEIYLRTYPLHRNHLFSSIHVLSCYREEDPL